MIMKKLFLFKTLLLSLLFFSSCDKEDHVSAVLHDALYELYPNAADVDWDNERNGYTVAEFYNKGVETSVWFKGSDWHHTRIDVEYGQLPQAVKDGLRNSKYGNWHIDDVDLVQFPSKPDEYLIEVESGNKERSLYFSLEGILL